MADEWSFGIEEEYFLADAKTGCAPVEQAAERFHEIAAAEVDAASHELLKGQVEVQSEPGVSLDVAHEALSDLRTRLCGIASDHGMQLIRWPRSVTRAPRRRTATASSNASSASSARARWCAPCTSTCPCPTPTGAST